MKFICGLVLSSTLWCALLSAEMAIEDRMLDLEAQLAILKGELEATNSVALQERPNAFNPVISAVADFVGQYGFGFKPSHHDDKKHDHGDHHHHDHDFKNGVLVREIEFEFRGDIDPYADALIALAVEPHGFDHVDIHLEEAFARLKLFGTATKLGRFRTAIGRIGRVHLHNIPQITYPLAMRAFLGNEGYSSQGFSFNTMWNPAEKTALSFFVEGTILNRLPMQEKGAEKMPQAIGHLWWHQELNPFHYLDVGGSALLGRKGKEGSGAFWLFGGDVHYSYVPAGYGQDPLFLLGNEFYAANPVSFGRWPLGNFTWSQVRLFDGTFAGVRYDIAPQEEDLISFQHGLGAYFTYYTSEFLRFRFGYEHVMPSIRSFDGDHRFMLSMLFVLGSHPVEPYFVNR